MIHSEAGESEGTSFGAFPDGESAVMLVGATLRHIASGKWGARKCLSMDWLRQQDLETQQSA